MTVLTKDEVKTIIAEKKGITKTAAEAWMKDSFETFTSIVTEYGAGFKFGDLVTFDVVDVEEKEREFTNLHTKEKFTKVISAHYALKAKVNKRTKEALIALKSNEA